MNAKQAKTPVEFHVEDVHYNERQAKFNEQGQKDSLNSTDVHYNERRRSSMNVKQTTTPVESHVGDVHYNER